MNPLSLLAISVLVMFTSLCNADEGHACTLISETAMTEYRFGSIQLTEDEILRQAVPIPQYFDYNNRNGEYVNYGANEPGFNASVDERIAGTPIEKPKAETVTITLSLPGGYTTIREVKTVSMPAIYTERLVTRSIVITQEILKPTTISTLEVMYETLRATETVVSRTIVEKIRAIPIISDRLIFKTITMFSASPLLEEKSNNGQYQSAPEYWEEAPLMPPDEEIAKVNKRIKELSAEQPSMIDQFSPILTTTVNIVVTPSKTILSDDEIIHGVTSKIRKSPPKIRKYTTKIRKYFTKIRKSIYKNPKIIYEKAKRIVI